MNFLEFSQGTLALNHQNPNDLPLSVILWSFPINIRSSRFTHYTQSSSNRCLPRSSTGFLRSRFTSINTPHRHTPTSSFHFAVLCCSALKADIQNTLTDRPSSNQPHNIYTVRFSAQNTRNLWRQCDVMK